MIASARFKGLSSNPDGQTFDAQLTALKAAGRKRLTFTFALSHSLEPRSLWNDARIATRRALRWDQRELRHACLGDGYRSGSVPCLRRFAVPRAGRVLLFAAEDALHIVRRRLEGISAAASVSLANLDIQVITAPTVRLDLDADRRNLAETVASLQPRLLILDPFVRLHRIDENASGEVAPLLAYLRELQRRHDVAVLVV